MNEFEFAGLWWDTPADLWRCYGISVLIRAAGRQALRRGVANETGFTVYI